MTRFIYTGLMVAVACRAMLEKADLAVPAVLDIAPRSRTPDWTHRARRVHVEWTIWTGCVQHWVPTNCDKLTEIKLTRAILQRLWVGKPALPRAKSRNQHI